MTGPEFDALERNDVLWMRTGHFTASRVRILSKDGAGATRRAWVDVLDHAPSQTSTQEINNKKGLPVSYRSLEA